MKKKRFLHLYLQLQWQAECLQDVEAHQAEMKQRKEISHPEKFII